jgi:CheY-like chemotaxis protein
VEDLEKMLRRLIGEHITLVTALDPNLGLVKADRAQLQQVLMNLAVNARDAMADGGRLLIETANTRLTAHHARQLPEIVAGPYVRLRVIDTGHGMDPQTKSQIFEPFFTTKDKGKGTGLGLSTVYGIVKQSGGYIWVESQPGMGACFEIVLPQVSGEQDQRPEHDEQSAYEGGATILVVEDQHEVRVLSAQMLAEQGYKVLEAPDGQSALELFERHKDEIDLLLTDVVMPGISGRVVADRIREARPETRVLFMSGYTDDEIMHQGIYHDLVDFLPKPFTMEELAAKVREVLRKPA